MAIGTRDFIVLLCNADGWYWGVARSDYAWFSSFLLQITWPRYWLL